MKVAVIIPFRDRGRDPLRQANLDFVLAHWLSSDYPIVAIRDDGRSGDDQFNRSAAYNRAVAGFPNIDVFVFAESDVLVDYSQIDKAVELAAAKPRLVVPFTEYRYLTPEDSEKVRAGKAKAQDCTPEAVLSNRRAHGCINVVSHHALKLVGGYDETFSGSWYDDSSMKKAFEICCGPTKFIEGPVCHLWHIPGWDGDHLTDEDKAATRRNQIRHARYRSASTTRQIRILTSGGYA